jgi:hypothetical protein
MPSTTEIIRIFLHSNLNAPNIAGYNKHPPRGQNLDKICGQK